MGCNLRDLECLDLFELLLTTAKGKPFRNKSKCYDELVNKYTKLLGNRRRDAIQWLFTNTARAMRNGYQGFTTKLSSGYWSDNVCGIGYRQVVAVLQHFENEGLILVLKGSRDYRDEKKCYPSVVRFTPKLTKMLDIEQVRIHLPSGLLEEPIVIKDRQTKAQLSVSPTAEVQSLVEEVKRYNTSLQEVSIEFNDKPLPLVEYKRSFSDDLFHGGRLFVHGGGIQLVPAEYRLEYITIDKEPIVELDYEANHPNILYERLFEDNPELQSVIDFEFDPYDADKSFISLDKEALETFKGRWGRVGYDPVRKLYKMALLLCINCSSFDQTRRTLANELYKDSKKAEGDRDFFGVIKPDCSRIIQALAEHNYMIERWFYNDMGVLLQNIDSKIALRVIDLLIQQGHTMLCYHDSFIVKSGVEGVLKDAMQQAWFDILGNSLFCSISKK